MAKEKLQLLIEQHGMQNVKKALKDLDTAAGGTAKSFGAIATQIGLTVAAGAWAYWQVCKCKACKANMPCSDNCC